MWTFILLSVVIGLIYKLAKGAGRGASTAGGAVTKGVRAAARRLSPVVLVYVVAVIVLPALLLKHIVWETLACWTLAGTGVVLYSVAYLRVYDEKKLTAIRQGGGIMGKIIEDQEYWREFDRYMTKKVEVMKPVDWDALAVYLKAHVVGQDAVIDAVIETTRFRWARKKKVRPIGVYFQGGESGTGKTHLAKTLAKGIFGEGMNFLRIDCGELGEETAAKIRLVGQTSGFVGDQGLLTSHLKNFPNSIVLFDEVEKAAPKVWDLMLPLFDEGRLTDQRTNAAVDGTRAVFILTSNLEKDRLAAALGAVNEANIADPYKRQRELNSRVKTVLAAASAGPGGMKVFRPELLNRIDDFFVFGALSPLAMGRIAALEIASYLKGDGVEEVDARDIDMELLGQIVQENVSMGETGAREIRGIVETLLRRPSQEAGNDGVTRVKVTVEEARGGDGEDHIVLIPTEVKPDAENAVEVLQKRYE